MLDVRLVVVSFWFGLFSLPSVLYANANDTLADLFIYPVNFDNVKIFDNCGLGKACAGLDGGHAGQDILLDAGTPIKAIADGKIAHYSCRNGYGELLVVINHNLPTKQCLQNGGDSTVCTNKLRSIYGHVRKSEKRDDTELDFSVGDEVKKGDIIGYINDHDIWEAPPAHCSDNTHHNGIGSPHLHFGLGLDHFTEYNAWGYGHLDIFTDGIAFIQKNNIKVHPFISKISGIVWLESDGFGDSVGKVKYLINNNQTNPNEVTPTIWTNSLIQFTLFQPILGFLRLNNPVNIEVYHGNEKLFGEVSFPFRDIKLAVAKYYSKPTTNMWKRGIVSGIGDTGFYGPEKSTSFAAFIKILVNASPNLELSECSAGQRPSAVNSFSNDDFPLYNSTEGPWYCQFYSNSTVNNWIKTLLTINSNTARPSQKIKRKEVAFFLSQALNLNGPVQGSSFSDVDANDSFAFYIELCKLYGIFDGYSDGTFAPDNEINRAELAKVIELAFNPSAYNQP